ncbi:MAG: hypothetical protein IPI67_32250 [Myxococcales bacterium]|nr:hypothetical protein [Myxococcales bacterium]
MRRTNTCTLLATCIALGCGGGDDGGSASTGGKPGSGGTANSGGNAGTTSTGGSGGAAGGAGAGGSGGTTIPTCAGTGGSPSGNVFHAALSGTASGDGSAAKPWDLPTALLGPAAVKPGDTVLVHGGVYQGGFVSKLAGQSGAPITLRSAPGEWATLDGASSTEPTLQVYKQWVVIRDLEVTNTAPDRKTTRPSGIYVEAQNAKLVNLVVHDTGTGVICNSAGATNPEYALELEVAGCILYNNGWDDVDRSHGHHLYLQNRDGTKHIFDNVVFNAFGFGVHAYSDTDKYFAEGYEIRGNVWFGNGAASAVPESPGAATSKYYDGCMVGHNGTHPVARVELKENFGWAESPGERDLRLGWKAPNEDAKLLDNYLVGDTTFQPSWKTVDMSGNTFIGAVNGVTTASYPNNTFQSAVPGTNKIAVRPNPWEKGRAHVIVYNWENADSVSVDVSAVVAPGAKYELRSVQDVFGAPVLSGTFDGKPLSVPMAAPSVAQPIGLPGAITPAEQPGKRFGVFLLTSAC